MLDIAGHSPHTGQHRNYQQTTFSYQIIIDSQTLYFSMLDIAGHSPHTGQHRNYQQTTFSYQIIIDSQTLYFSMLDIAGHSPHTGQHRNYQQGQHRNYQQTLLPPILSVYQSQQTFYDSSSISGLV